MSLEQEIYALNAEKIAVQQILMSVLRSLIRMNPAFEIAIKQGFDEAADSIEHIAIAHGATASPDHLAKAVKIVEDLRKVVFTSPEKPKHGI